MTALASMQGLVIENQDVEVKNSTGSTIVAGDVVRFGIITASDSATNNDQGSTTSGLYLVETVGGAETVGLFGVMLSDSTADGAVGLCRVKGRVKAQLAATSAAGTGLTPGTAHDLEAYSAAANEPCIALAMEVGVVGTPTYVLFDGISGMACA